ncbi:MAG: DUF177 domain-containing protein [Oscillospiraceae bacterium]|jgi:uncharacterized protein|nr:DUF177 domain-containing protein [Oscillospiraceae bacterium]
MQLDVAQALSAPGEEIPFALTGDLPSLPWDGDTLRFLQPVALSGIVTAMGENLWLRGRLRAKCSLPCARCLEDAPFDCDVPLMACFQRDPDPDDPDVFAYAGHTLALDEALWAALLPNVPMQPLCAPGCKGLCPHCGVNRNLTPCACQQEAPAKRPFSALASFLTKDEEV